MRSKNNAVLIFLFTCIAIVELAFIFLVPPFQKPDEETHFLKALSISKGILSCSKERNNYLSVDKQYPQLIQTIASYRLPLNNKNKIPFSSLYQRNFFSTKNEQVVHSIKIDHLCYFPVVPYTPQAVALFATSLIHLNAYYSFYLGRLTIGLLAFCIFILLFKKVPSAYKNLYLFTISIPMFLHQITSYSPDAVHFLLGLSIFVLILDKLEKQRIERQDILWFFILSLLFLLSRTGGHEFFPFLVFLIPFKKFNLSLKKYVILFVVYFAILFSVYGVTKIGAYESFMTSASSGIKAQPNLQIQRILHNPLEYISVIGKTTYVRSLFYFQGMFGLFGWLEYGLPHIIYFVYLIVLLYILYSIRVPDNRKFFLFQHIYLSLLIILSYLYLLSIFYITWTSVGAKIVDGIQGRYFLTLFPFIGLLSIQLTQNLFGKKKLKSVIRPKIFKIALILIITSVTISIPYTIILRYYIK